MTASAIASIAAVVSLVAALMGAATTATVAHAASGCSASVFVWDGSASSFWSDPRNWDQNCVPGQRQDTPYDDHVTIPTGATVVLRAGESADLAELRSSGSLTVATGAFLVLHGASSSATMLLKGALAGEGALTVTSSLVMTSSTTEAATQTTRRCDLTDCSHPALPPQPGRTVIARGATMSVTTLGVNLQDGRVIENHGRVVLRGYIAADYGTSFLNVRDSSGTGQLVLQRDVGFYQGVTTPGLPVATFVNTGQILKSGGTGTSIIDATYSDRASGNPYRGTVVVRTGEVSISGSPSDHVRTATVSQGASLSTGSCSSPGAPSACATPVATADNPQATTVALTDPGTTTSAVTIDTTTEPNPGGLGSPVRIETPAAQATTSAPLVFTLRLDGTTLGGVDPAYAAQHRAVLRKPDGGVYTALPSCATSPLGGSVIACVDRAASGADGDDLVVVVRSLANSRYRIGAPTG